jgi:hypothetical protein
MMFRESAAPEVEIDDYARRAGDCRPTIDVPLIGQAPDELLIERWSMASIVALDPDHVFAGAR